MWCVEGEGVVCRGGGVVCRAGEGVVCRGGYGVDE